MTTSDLRTGGHLSCAPTSHHAVFSHVNLAGKSKTDCKWNLKFDLKTLKSDSARLDNKKPSNSSDKTWHRSDLLSKLVTAPRSRDLGQSLARWWLFHCRLTGPQLISKSQKVGAEEATASEHELPSAEIQFKEKLKWASEIPKFDAWQIWQTLKL